MSKLAGSNDLHELMKLMGNSASADHAPQESNYIENTDQIINIKILQSEK